MVPAREPDPSAIEAGLADWMTAHPAATLLEIEHEVDRRLGAYRAALIAGAAQREGSLDPPGCPACGEAMRRDGRRAIRQTTAHQGELVVEGQAWRCPACGAGLFPPR